MPSTTPACSRRRARPRSASRKSWRTRSSASRSPSSRCCRPPSCPRSASWWRAAPEAVQENVRLMREAVNAAKSVVRGLLTFGRKMPLEKTQVDLAELTEGVLALTFGDLHVAEVKIRKDIAPGLPPVWADTNQLQQVLVNLNTNARQAMADREGERSLPNSRPQAAPDSDCIVVADHV